jgi:uncharacterized protein YcgI (DUF1989 family)
MSRRRIEAQRGVSFMLRRGQLLRVIDPYGEQVADLTAFAAAPRSEWLSSGRTIDYNDTIYLTAGHSLYSNRSRIMFTIVEDTVGRHDFLYTPCSPDTFRLIYHNTAEHPSCFENICTALGGYGIAPDQIPTTFNIFMNVDLQPNGTLKVLPPRSIPGDSIVLRAEMDVVVALTACSAEMSNNYRFKPIDFEISG